MVMFQLKYQVMLSMSENVYNLAKCFVLVCVALNADTFSHPHTSLKKRVCCESSTDDHASAHVSIDSTGGHLFPFETSNNREF